MMPRGRIALTKKLSIVQTSRRLRDLILSYVDEVTKDDTVSGISPEVLRNLRDLPDEQRFRCFGEVKGALTNIAPQHQLEALAEWWSTRTSHLKRKAFHHTFALHPDFAAELRSSGVPVTDALFDCVTRTYSAYAEQFYGDDELGYLVGIHREKSHPHAHVLVFPYTRKARRLNFSRLAPTVLDGREVRVDFQGFLQDRFAFEVEGYRQVLIEQRTAAKKRTLPEKLLFANLVFSSAQTAEKTKSEIPFEVLVKTSADESLKAADLAGSLIAQRSVAIKRVQEEREGVILRGGLPLAAQVLQQRAQTLREQFLKEVFSADSADVLTLRAARLTARLLEIVGAVTNRLPPHLVQPINTRAVRGGSLKDRADTDQLKAIVERQTQRYIAANRIQPLSAIVNQSLGPTDPDAIQDEADPEAKVVLQAKRVTQSGIPKPILAPDPSFDRPAALLEIERRARDLEENARNQVTLTR